MNIIISKENVKNIFIHTFIWVGYMFYELSLLILLGETINWFETISAFIVYAIIVYASALYFFPKILPSPKIYFLFLFYIVGLIVFYLALRYFIISFIVPFFNSNIRAPFTNWSEFVATGLYRLTYFTVISFVYYFFRRIKEVERQKLEIEKEKTKNAEALLVSEEALRLSAEQALVHEHRMGVLQKERDEAEIGFLRAQINPHFLYNTLNFFYAKVFAHSHEAADGINLLVKMMKYALQKEDSKGMVTLDEEIEHLRNFIHLNQLRYSNTLQIQFNVKGVTMFRNIIPLVLVTFVENVIKHGDLLDPKKPAVISLELTSKQLIFSTRNKIRKGPKEKSTGIGLDNTIKRLNLSYNNAYSLKIDENEEFYLTQFTLNI
jgi:two-component system, LytTR family, sensor kinase